MSKLVYFPTRKIIALLLASVLSATAALATDAARKNPMPPKAVAKFIRLEPIDAKKFYGTNEESKASLYEARLEILNPEDAEVRRIREFLVQRDPAHVATDDSWHPLGLTVEEKVRQRYQQMAEAYLLAHDDKGSKTGAEQLSPFVPSEVVSLLEQQFPTANQALQDTSVVEWRFGAFGCIEQPGYQPRAGMLANYEGDAKGGQLFWKGQEWCRGDGYPAPKSALLASVQTLADSKGTLSLIAMGVGLVVALVLGVLIWLAPILIAKRRGHPNFMPIAIITVLLGWTFIGWALCLAWSFSRTSQSQRGAVAV